MEYRRKPATTSAAGGEMEACPYSVSNTPSILSNPSSPPPLPAARPRVIMSPCAACKILRRRCVENCVLAPYFPPTEPLKFTIAHRIFGASNIIKLLQELPEDQRADAVNSMVYEASARLRDPIYGCTGAICHLQNQISGLQAELAKAQAEIFNMQCQNASLSEVISKQILNTQNIQENNLLEENDHLYIDDGNLGVSWGSLWT